MNFPTTEKMLRWLVVSIAEGLVGALLSFIAYVGGIVPYEIHLTDRKTRYRQFASIGFTFILWPAILGLCLPESAIYTPGFTHGREMFM
jgi:hypothetical protein